MVRKIVFLILILILPVEACPGSKPDLEIYFFDVGKGAAVLIRYREKCNILIDTGNPITGIDLAKYLWNQGIRNIDHLFITHPHPDHGGGLVAISKFLKVRHIWGNGQNIGSEYSQNDYYKWYRKYLKNISNYKVISNGSFFTLGSKSKIIQGNSSKDLRLTEKKIESGIPILKILWPPKKHIFESWNLNSIVILLEFRKFRFLFMGDTTRETERELLKNYDLPRIDFLLAGHHGAWDTASPEFLEKIKPKNVIISVDKDNELGYPSRDVLSRYQKIGSKVYRTDRDGTIVVKLSGQKNFTISFDKTNKSFTTD